MNSLPSPIRSIKAVKNSVELEKTRGCQVRLIKNDFLHFYKIYVKFDFWNGQICLIISYFIIQDIRLQLFKFYLRSEIPFTELGKQYFERAIKKY